MIIHEIKISIPQWFDFNVDYYYKIKMNNKFQSHNGLILIYEENQMKTFDIPFQSHNGLILIPTLF